MLKIYSLRCEQMLSPIGISIRKPVLSWKSESSSNNMLQTAYRVIVSESREEIMEGDGSFFDTGKRSADINHCKLGRILMKSAMHYYWAVKIWDNHGEESDWSDIGEFETGLLYESDWSAKWVEPLQKPTMEDGVLKRYLGDYSATGLDNNESNMPIDERLFSPCQMLRKEFDIIKTVKRARLYATAHGIYSLELNGKRVGDTQLMPEITTYEKILQYQTYDITDMLQSEKNAIGAVIADGWWAGRTGAFGDSAQYGNMLGLLMQINIDYEDGTVDKIGTDASFRSYEGPWRYADLKVGEKYDARYEEEGWSKPGYKDNIWQTVNEREYSKDNLVGQNAEPIRIYERLKPKRIFTSAKGENIIDFGQCVSGYAIFKLNGKRGQEVEFHHTQMLDKDGNFWLKTMGISNTFRDTYIFKGEEEEIYEPRFTYRGFQYICVKGYDGELKLENIEVRAIASDFSAIGDFKCSDEKINRLQSCIKYSILSNYVAIPTDDCDRERAGWTGDAQIMASTANFMFNLLPFYKRWMSEFRAEQFEDGRIQCTVPMHNSLKITNAFSNGWSDACIIIPWETYKTFGDKDILIENYEMMQRWMDYCITSAKERNPENIGEMTIERKKNLEYIRNADFQWGDWLTPSGNYDEDGNYVYFYQPMAEYTPCFFMTYCLELLSKIATIIDKPDDAAFYQIHADHLRKATIAEYFDSGYIMNNHFQGATILALKGGFYAEKKREEVVDRLLELIKKHNGMDVGFASAPFITEVLTNANKVDTAYDILFNEECGGWLYEINQGATTLWEEWNAKSPEGELKPVSFDLPTYGCIGAWLYSTVAGINCVKAGYKKSRIAPILDPKGRLAYAEAKTDTPYGTLFSKWEIADGKMKFTVEIPANTQAEIVLPCIRNLEGVSVNGTALDKAIADTGKIFVGSGKYVYEYSMN